MEGFQVGGVEDRVIAELAASSPDENYPGVQMNHRILSGFLHHKTVVAVAIQHHSKITSRPSLSA